MILLPKSPVFVQDESLVFLGLALRGEQTDGFSDGVSKSLVYELVLLVRELGLCKKHNLKLIMSDCECDNVYCVCIAPGPDLSQRQWAVSARRSGVSI